MKPILNWTVIVFCVSLVGGLIAGCTANKKNTLDKPAYVREITAWQQKRASRISAEDGWISLAGLFWLKSGINTFGSDSGNAIVLPPGAPPVAGSLLLKDGKVTFVAKKNSGVKVNDSLVTRTRLLSDADTSSPQLVSLGSVNFYIIKRAERFGVRVKDKQNPARLHFAGLKFFPIDEQWKITGKYTKYDSPLQMPIATVIGTTDTFACPGEVRFTVHDTSLTLVAMAEQGSEGELYFMFSDETSGKETYGAGRQLYTSLPDSAGTVLLDFNKAINWPCAYTSFATCPIPPSKNHLNVCIEAGEMIYPGHSE